MSEQETIILRVIYILIKKFPWLSILSQDKTFCLCHVCYLPITIIGQW